MDEYMGAVGGKAAGDSAADPARGAGDEGSLVGKWLGHGTLQLKVEQRWECCAISSRYPNYRILEF